jgi:hypothetical protein
MANSMESIPAFVSFLRQWADRLEKRHSDFLERDIDFSGLLSHAEQLSREMEGARVGAPVYKNAEDAMKRAVAKTSKVLKEIMADLEGMNGEMESQQDLMSQHLKDVAQCIGACSMYSKDYRDSCIDFEGDQMQEKKSKKEKEKKRSNSPSKKRRERSMSSFV